MEKRSKTNKEIYEQKYQHEKILKDPLLCVEAIGYLKALIEYLPSEENWAKKEISSLMIVLIAYTY